MTRILVVDDDPSIVELLDLNFSLDGHEVISADDGPTALALVERERPDVVLLDVMMPELDGYSVCAQLRADPETAELPVVLVSARAQSADLDRGREVGCTAYVTKPFDPMELLQLVERLVADDAGAASDD